MINIENVDFNPWLQDGGLLSTQSMPNGNMIGYTAQAMCLIMAMGQQQSSVYKSFQKALYLSTPKPGVLSRYPTPLTDTSIDDYLSAAAGCPTLAIEMIERGKTHLGFMSVKDWPPLSQWLGRFPAFWVHCEFAYGGSPNLIAQLIWSIALIYSAHQPLTNQDAWMQSHLMIMAYRRRQMPTILCEKAVNYWISKKTQPMRQIVSAYIGNPAHPLALLWEDFYLWP